MLFVALREETRARHAQVQAEITRSPPRKPRQKKYSRVAEKVGRGIEMKKSILI